MASDTPTIVIDPKKSDAEIHRELRARFPHVVDLCWEIDRDGAGRVWSGRRELAELRAAS